MDKAAIMQQVFAGSTALAGLILVFIGGIYAAFESYQPEQKQAVARKFRCRAWFTFLGFLAALVSSAFSLYFNWANEDWVFWCSVDALIVSFVVLFVMAIVSNLDIK